MDYGVLTIYFICLLLLPVILIAVVIKSINWYIDDTRKFPLNDITRRSAGEFAREQYKAKFQMLYILAATLPVLLVSLYSVYALSDAEQVLRLKWLVYLMVLVFLLHTYFIVRYMYVTGALKLQAYAESVVGEELNRLMLLGFRVYHDIKVNNISIDHLLVGTKGVFAVTVASHAKVLNKKQQFRMAYEDKALVFPNRKDKKVLQTAQKQANFAMAWLKKTGGDVIKVRPVVVIPGWYVELKVRPPFPVLTTKQINTFFSRIGKDQLDQYTLEKLVNLIEQNPAG